MVFNTEFETIGKVVAILISDCSIEYRVEFIHPETNEKTKWYKQEKDLL